MAASSNITGGGLTDSFDKEACTYESRMKTAARSVARHIVSALKPLPLDAVFCDNACGTGAVTAEILRVFPHATVHATDHSQGMLNLLQQSLQKNGKASQVELGLLNSIQVTLEDDLCDLHIMNFGIFFTTDPRQTAIEINRTLKKGGRAALSPANLVKELLILDKWSNPETMRSTLSSAGFSNIDIKEQPVMFTSSDLQGIVVSVTENVKAMSGTNWIVDEKANIEGTARDLLTQHPDRYLSVNEQHLKGISWTAWVATTDK